LGAWSPQVTFQEEGAAHGTKQQKNNIVSYLILQFSKNNTMMDYALQPAPLPPLLFASSGRHKDHSLDHASRRGPRPGGTKITRSITRHVAARPPATALVRVVRAAQRSLVKITRHVAACPSATALVHVVVRSSSGRRKGHLSKSRVTSLPAPLPPLLFASSSGRRRAAKQHLQLVKKNGT
jgi:hypothetical protein